MVVQSSLRNIFFSFGREEVALIAELESLEHGLSRCFGSSYGKEDVPRATISADSTGDSPSTSVASLYQTTTTSSRVAENSGINSDTRVAELEQQQVILADRVVEQEVLPYVFYFVFCC